MTRWSAVGANADVNVNVCLPVSFCRCNPGDFGGVEFLRVDEFGSIFSRDAFVMNMLTVMICGQNITSLMILVHVKVMQDEPRQGCTGTLATAGRREISP